MRNVKSLLILSVVFSAFTIFANDPAGHGDHGQPAAAVEGVKEANADKKAEPTKPTETKKKVEHKKKK